jgi:vacuolar-type H+-ATPase subunit H
MKIKTLMLAVMLGAALTWTSSCSKKEAPAPSTAKETEKAASTAVGEAQKTVETNKVTAEAAVEAAKTTGASAVDAAKAKAQEVIDKAKGLVAENKYQDALDALQGLAGTRLSDEQQKIVDGLKKQIQEALAKKVESDATSAVGGLLGGKK